MPAPPRIHRRAAIPTIAPREMRAPGADGKHGAPRQPSKAIAVRAQRRLKSILAALDAQHPMEQRLNLGPFVHWRGNASSPVHRWLRYREAYSPELIDQLKLGDRILDPFSGCGSIPIGAALRGKRAVGIDLNPLATFSSHVKLTPLARSSIDRLQRFIAALPTHIAAHSRWPLPKLSVAEKVFEPLMLETLLRARSAIEARFTTDAAARDFALLAWLATLESVGSYFKEGNGIKYRNKKRQRGRYDTRPEGEWQRARFGANQQAFYLKTFAEHLNLMLADTAAWHSGSWDEQRVIHGNAFDLSALLGGETFDAVIFSPPYANRFDYFEAFKVELWFGNFIETYEELHQLRKASLRSHLNADFKRPVRALQPLEELLELMDRDASSWRMGVPALMRGYFHDLGIVLEQCRRAAPRGRCHVVVGNSAFGGVIVPTDVLTATVGLRAGFKRARIVAARHLTVAPQQRAQLQGFEPFMRESIVFLE